MQAGGDGFGWRVTAENMTLQNSGVFIPCHICEIPTRGETTGSIKTYKAGKKKTFKNAREGKMRLTALGDE